MLHDLFAKVKIPPDRPLLVHARLRNIHRQTGIGYKELSDNLLECLLECKPSHLLIPAYTIYSFMLSRIFHLDHSRSEVGRFSEELRLQDFKRTFDPMYSMLDILNSLPDYLDYSRTFGPDTVNDYLCGHDGIVVNVDMPGFYATPVHGVELDHKVSYRHNIEVTGHIQRGNNPWNKCIYSTYIRAIDRHGNGSFPPYNQQRRIDYLRKFNTITEYQLPEGHLAWAPLSNFCSAISAALTEDPFFLVDP